MGRYSFEVLVLLLKFISYTCAQSSIGTEHMKKGNYSDDNDAVVFRFMIYLQSECIERYQVELCSTYDREHDFDVIQCTWTSPTLSQAEVDMLQAFK